MKVKTRNFFEKKLPENFFSKQIVEAKNFGVARRHSLRYPEWKIERRYAMTAYPNTLTVIDGETLMDKRLPPTKFCVDTLLPQGLCILGGSPKIGKSWFVLDLCVHVARGEPIWNLSVMQGEALYLCLEDSERRIQERLNTVTDDVPPGLYFATGSTSIESGVCDWLRDFKDRHPDVIRVAIDTFQLIRTPSADVSYGNDYAELQPLRLLADELGISLLLVHHLRKMGDKDPINKLSGSTGIAGAVDAIFVLEKNERTENGATLYASGRDIRDRKLALEMNPDTCAWILISDSLQNPEVVMPDELVLLYHYMRGAGAFVGSNTDLALCIGATISPKGLKQMMNRWRYKLEELGVYFRSKRSNGQKYVAVRYLPGPTGQVGDPSAARDDLSSAPENCDPSVPCVPGTEGGWGQNGQFDFQAG